MSQSTTPLQPLFSSHASLAALAAHLKARGILETASSKQTTLSSQRDLGWVTVIHPHHPLCGQQVEIVRVRRGLDPDLIIRHLDGYHGAIAARWTTYASAPEKLAGIPKATSA